MITHIELNNAKMYAGLKTNTKFQKRELIRFFLKAHGHSVRVINNNDELLEKAFITAKEHFK